MAKFKIAALAIAASVAFSAPASAATNLVRNGDFEQQLANWTVIPGPEIQAATGASYQAGAGATGSAAALANTFAAFGGGNKPNFSTLISDAFDTVAGTVYKLTFDYAQFAGVDGSQRLSFAVFGNGITTLAGTEQQAGGTNLDTIFKGHRLYFTGSGSPANIAFSIAGSPTTNTDAFLDNVVITAVPEASTWALLLIGFGGLGAALRRRRNQAAVAVA